jgi:hypothetical protein
MPGFFLGDNSYFFASRHFLSRTWRRDFKPPKIDLETLRLQQNLPRRRKHVEGSVDLGAVDVNLDAAPLANALDLRPFAEGAFDVVFAACVEEFLEARLVEVPPELAVREGADLAAGLPARAFVGTEDRLRLDRDGDFLACFVFAADDDEVADAALGELAFNARHPRAAGAAVGADGVQEDAGVAYELAAVGFLPHLYSTVR